MSNQGKQCGTCPAQGGAATNGIGSEIQTFELPGGWCNRLGIVFDNHCQARALLPVLAQVEQREMRVYEALRGEQGA